MDLNSGFWQVEFHQSDREKTAFSTHQGLYQFVVMPFGTVKKPSTFERLLEDALRGLHWQECILYMDDIIVPGSCFVECIKRLTNVFERLIHANLKLKPSKCVFFQKRVKFLGHIVSEEGICTDPDKISAVRNWPIPINVKQVRSFVGLASYYRRFVRGFAKIARPLHKICEKGVKFSWTDECDTAFRALKVALTSSPILTYPIPGKTFILDTDAIQTAIGAVLSQEFDEKEQVIAYTSKALNKAEQSYYVTRKELLAVVFSFKHFHSYLYGQHVLLRTDNSAVSRMRNLKNPTGQTARWLQELGTYELTVVHRPGQMHVNADALSRIPCNSCQNQQRQSESETTEEDGEAQVMDECKPNQIRAITRSKQKNGNPYNMKEKIYLMEDWDPQTIRRLQLEDQEISDIFIGFEDKKRPEWNDISEKSAAVETLWRQWDRLKIHGGMLYRNWVENEFENDLQLITPTLKKEEAIKHFHDIPSAGHLGVDKTIGKLQQSFYWPAMKQSVAEYVKKCDSCAVQKQLKMIKATMGQFIVGEPMERVAMDILGPLPMSKNGNKYVLVISDLFTKWKEALPIPDQEAKTVATTFVNEFVSRFETPLQLYSDQGRNFESQIFQELCNLLHIEKTRSTSMRPQANSCVERFNRTLVSMMKMYCQDNQNNWDEYLPQLLMAYRSSKHTSTK